MGILWLSAFSLTFLVLLSLLGLCLLRLLKGPLSLNNLILSICLVVVIYPFWLWALILLGLPQHPLIVLSLPIAIVLGAMPRLRPSDLKALHGGNRGEVLLIALGLAASLLVHMSPLVGREVGFAWNDSAHTEIAQLLVDVWKDIYWLTYTPGFHLIAAAVNMIAGIEVRFLIPALGGFFTSLTFLTIYYAGRRLKDSKCGLYAGYVYLALNFFGVGHNYFFGTGPMMASFFLLPALVALTIKGHEGTDRFEWITLAVLTLGLIIFYPYTMAAFLFFYIPTAIYQLCRGSRVRNSLKVLGAIMAGVVIAIIASLSLNILLHAQFLSGATSLKGLLAKFWGGFYWGRYIIGDLSLVDSAIIIYPALIMLLLSLYAFIRLNLRGRELQFLPLAIWAFLLTFFLFGGYNRLLVDITVTPNVTFLNIFIPLTLFSGLGLAALEGDLARVSLRRALRVALVLGLSASAFWKASALMEIARERSPMTKDDVACLKWVGEDNKEDYAVLNNGATDIGFWLPALGPISGGIRSLKAVHLLSPLLPTLNPIRGGIIYPFTGSPTDIDPTPFLKPDKLEEGLKANPIPFDYISLEALKERRVKYIFFGPPPVKSRRSDYLSHLRRFDRESFLKAPELRLAFRRGDCYVLTLRD